MLEICSPSRRRLLVGLAAAMAAPPMFGQAGRRLHRVGIAFNSNLESAKPYLDAFVLGMDEKGYGFDREYALEIRYAQGRNDRYPAMMSDLLRANSELILVGPNTGVEAAKAATHTVPIVMAGTTDPEATGLVASLSRPGGNVTGLALNSASLNAKRLQLLQEIVPGGSRMTYLRSEGRRCCVCVARDGERCQGVGAADDESRAFHPGAT